MLNDFSKTTITALASKGIKLVGLQHIDGPFGGSTAYILDDNGWQRLRTFNEVLALAK